MLKDVEQIVASISKTSMINRIRFLVSDPDFIHPTLKAGKNNVYLMMCSSIKTMQMFQTPGEKAREVQQLWLKKLI